ncbi:MAG: hypothetical protein OXF94_01415, partial [Gammaproteobacteria bacterium]|nr:hypothetical protein [Gammaproteobacteria bacterium]
QLKEGNFCDDSRLEKALTAWRLDATVFLPEDEIDARLSLLLPKATRPRIREGGSWEVRDQDLGGAPDFG